MLTVGELDGVAVIPFHEDAQAHLHALSFEFIFGGLPQVRGERRQQAFAAFDQDDLGLPVHEFGILPRQDVTGELREGAGILHTGRPAARNHKGQPRRSLRGIKPGGRFKTPQDVVAQCERFAQVLEPV